VKVSLQKVSWIVASLIPSFAFVLLWVLSGIGVGSWAIDGGPVFAEIYVDAGSLALGYEGGHSELPFSSTLRFYPYETPDSPPTDPGANADPFADPSSPQPTFMEVFRGKFDVAKNRMIRYIFVPFWFLTSAAIITTITLWLVRSRYRQTQNKQMEAAVMAARIDS